MATFIWDRKNLDHIAKHGVKPAEAEYVVENARPPYPRYIASADKFLVRGQTTAGRYLQAIYVLESHAVGIDYEEVDLLQLDLEEEAFYVIHARPLTPRERQLFKRRRR